MLIRGIFTSEFWLHALGQILTWTDALPMPANDRWITSAVGFGAYAISRGLAKSSAVPAPSQSQAESLLGKIDSVIGGIAGNKPPPPTDPTPIAQTQEPTQPLEYGPTTQPPEAPNA